MKKNGVSPLRLLAPVLVMFLGIVTGRMGFDTAGTILVAAAIAWVALSGDIFRAFRQAYNEYSDADIKSSSSEIEREIEAHKEKRRRALERQRQQAEKK
jgi:divalent metal cation (Fe/Co/Zn/Cd) transporter